MAQPTAQTRTEPTGHHLEDGMGDSGSLVALQLNSAILFWEITVKPPMIDGGEKIDQTTMWNLARRTAAPRFLYEVGELVITCAYRVETYSDIISIINTVQAITCIFSNGGTFSDWGWVQKFEPDALEEGVQPKATVTIVFGGEDPNNQCVEAQPYVDDTGVCV